MILRSNLSIRGLYNWDSSLFEYLVLPESVNKDILVSNILSELGELEILYPDSEYMKELIGVWSNKELPNWNRYADMLNIDYDPLNNYVKTTHHEGEDESHTINQVKGYNETDFVDTDKSDSTGANSFDRTVKGNVGIRSFSDLIEEELNLRQKYNLYDMIIEDFKLRFCILVY